MTGNDTAKALAVPAFETLAPVCAGLLLCLAILPVAALSPRWELAKFAVFGEIAVVPAFVFLCGFVLDGALGWRRLARLVALGCGAAGFAALAALSTRRGWQAGLADCAPALRLILLPALYALTLRMLGKAPAGLLVFLALLAHVAGAIVGGRAAFALAPAPFFVFGALAARNSARLLGLFAREREYVAAAGPVALALALIVATQARGASTLAGVGPIALLVGFVAGPAALAAAWTLAATRAAPYAAAIGRAAPALAVGWLPLFFFVVAVARRGGVASPASLVLFSSAAFLVVLIAADAFGEAEAQPAPIVAASGPGT
ncbi:MAG: hypothetical protein U1E28_14975 [Beijerinckiaceae bacterium]